MSTILANPATMIEQGAPHLIHSDKELEHYTEVLFRLTAKTDPTDSEFEAIDLLSALIQLYEREHYPIPAAEPIDVLRYLMDRNGLKQQDLTGELGSIANVSLILSGQRNLTLRHIQALSSRFKLPITAFVSSAR